MLPLPRIREFLRHPDADIRLAAARYFDEAHDCGDATMHDWWAAADALGFDAVRTLLHHLEEVPDDDATLARLFAELRKGLPAKVWFPMRRRLERMPFELLERRIGDLRDARPLLTPGDILHAEERLALKNAAPEELWERLMAHASESEGSSAGGQDGLLVFRLNEALARQPEFSAPRALAILGDASIEDWREIFAVELAGVLRCREAIGPLIAKLRIDADYLLERARAALVRIGDPGIPARIAADWEKEEWGFKNYAHGAIASFRGAESVALLRDLIGREEDGELQIFMAVSLLEMLPGDETTLGEARQFILGLPRGAGIEALDELLATVATMAGWHFPERAEWRARAIAQEERMRRISEGDEAFEETVRTGMIAGLSFREAGDLAHGPMREDDFAPVRRLAPEPVYDRPPAVPHLREAPKIGRNDPCPCNSGKKFKKCCGKAA